MRNQVIPTYLWREKRFRGTVVNKTKVIVFGETYPLSIEIEGNKLETVFYGVQAIARDCILGCDFVNMVNLVAFDVKGQELKFRVNNQQIQTQMYKDGV